MLPQHLVYKNELNREYVITLARNDETPWWWSKKIETCRSGFKCFKWKLYRCICWLIVDVIYICIYIYIYSYNNYCDSLIFPKFCVTLLLFLVGRDSSVGIATHYGLDGPGIESRWGAIFSAPVHSGPGAHPPSSTNVYPVSFLKVERPGSGVHHPPLSCAEVKER